MNNLIIYIVIIVVILVLLTFNNKELFYQAQSQCIGLKIEKPKSLKNKIGFHTRVYPYDPKNYDKFFGPKCLNTCLIEHIAKINLKNISEKVTELTEEERKDIFNWNHTNPDKNFCHKANILEPSLNIKKCTGTCLNKCGNKGEERDADNNIIEGSEFDYSRCKIENSDCIEEPDTAKKNRLVNYLSGGAILNSTRCSGEFEGNKLGCVNKYIDNIESIKIIYNNYRQNIIDKENQNIQCV